jgi:hypothetical protein
MKELILEVESLEERIAPCCCDPSLISANPTVTANYSNVNVGPQTNLALNLGSGTVQQSNGQAAGNYAFVSTYQST